MRDERESERITAVRYETTEEKHCGNLWPRTCRTHLLGRSHEQLKNMLVIMITGHIT